MIYLTLGSKLKQQKNKNFNEIALIFASTSEDFNNNIYSRFSSV